MTSEGVVRTLRGETVVFTGTVDVDGKRVTRRALIGLARSAGATVSPNERARVGSSTTLLVRGHKGEWRNGAYGADEEEVAALQTRGHAVRIVDERGFSSLLRGGWAPIVKPHQDSVPLPAWTCPYRPGAVDEETVPVPSAADRRAANAAHNSVQDLIAELAVQHGFVPLSPGHPSAQFDVGWEDRDQTLHLVEVKSLNAGNEDRQARLGFGQVLDYAKVLEPRRTAAAVAFSEVPRRADHWTALGSDHGVRVVWPGRLERLFG